jgi:hypothetical protein
LDLTRFSIELLEAYSALLCSMFVFLQLWQATRFALLNFDASFQRPASLDALSGLLSASPSLCDAWILHRLHTTVASMDAAFKAYEFANATTAIYNFWLYDLCDVYLVSGLHSFDRSLLFLSSLFLSSTDSTYRTCSKSAAPYPIVVWAFWGDVGCAVCHSVGLSPKGQQMASTRSFRLFRGNHPAAVGW